MFHNKDRVVLSYGQTTLIPSSKGSGILYGLYDTSSLNLWATLFTQQFNPEKFGNGLVLFYSHNKVPNNNRLTRAQALGSRQQGRFC